MKSNHEKVLYQCDKCGFKTMTKARLERNLSVNHPTRVDNEISQKIMPGWTHNSNLNSQEGKMGGA